MPTSVSKNSKNLFALLAFTFIYTVTFSQTVLKGKVTDAKTGEPLAGASVKLDGAHLTTLVKLDGTYIFKNIQPGTYELKASYEGYKKFKDFKITIQSGSMQIQDILLEPDQGELASVQVVAISSKESDIRARRLEAVAPSVMNILSAQSIQLLPDLTIANALQRISGVVIQRDNAGEGRYAIIRGMAQRYNSTLVNGIKIPSPDDKFRFVPMNLFPSDMVERLEVIKALTPDLEGDAIGGTMNLVMKSAPTHLVVDAYGSMGYNTLFSNRPFTSFDRFGVNFKAPSEIYGNSYFAGGTNGQNQQLINTNFPGSTLHYKDINHPLNSTMGLTLGNRFFHDKLGIMLSGTYQNFYQGSNSEFLIPQTQPRATHTEANIPAFSDAYFRRYSTQTNRTAIHTNWDYVINSKNTINFYGMFVRQNDYQTRYTIDTVLNTNSSRTYKLLDIQNRSTWQQQTIFNYTLSGKHVISDLVKFDWQAVYSKAKNEIPDYATYDFQRSLSYSQSGQLTNQGDSVSANNTMNRRWQHNSDQDKAFYGNFILNPKIFNENIIFKIGGLYRDKDRSNYLSDYTLSPLVTSYSGGNNASTSGAYSFTGLDQNPYYFYPASGGQGNTTSQNNNTYQMNEKVSAGYLSTQFTIQKKLEVNGGVRVEHTRDHYQTAVYPTVSYTAGTISYTDVLPSINLKYYLKTDQHIRLAYFKAISRPGFGEIVPISNPGEIFTEKGNDSLKHTRSDNFDLRYEWFMDNGGQLLVGTYYKHLTNPIETFVVPDGNTAQAIKPQNTNSAKNYGFEIVYTKFFGMFGINANYTYTYSRVSTPKAYYYYDSAMSNIPGLIVGNTYKYPIQSRPLQGQAPHVANLSVLYKNPKAGLNMQLAYSYTGSRIAIVSPSYNLDFWQNPLNQLDFSADYKIFKGLLLYVKVNNLTNAPSSQYLKYPIATANAQLSGFTLPFQTGSSNRILVQKNVYNTTFLVGLRFHLNGNK